MLGALSNQTYRRLLAAQILSVLGSGLITVALGLLAYELAGSDAAMVLGIALAIKMLAYVGLAPIAAALAVWIPRRGFLVTLDLCRAGLVLLLPFVTQVWQIYILVFAFQAFSAAFTPTFQATIPDILTDEKDYTQALSLSRLTYDIESLVSPLLAGLLLSILSFHFLFAGTALGFLLSCAFILSVTLPKPKDKIIPLSFSKRLTRGMWIYLNTPRLRGLLSLYLAVASASAMVIVNTVVHVKETLALGDEFVALYFGAFGLGSIFVAIILPRLFTRIKLRSIMIFGGMLLCFMLALAGFGRDILQTLLPSLIIWLFLGAGVSLIQTPSGLLLNRSCHEEDRPAVFAAQFSLSHACWLLAYLAAGFLGTWYGLEITFIYMAVISGFGVILAMSLWPMADPKEIEHEHQELEHTHPFGDSAHHADASAEFITPLHHTHKSLSHKHRFIIDDHHPKWPK